MISFVWRAIRSEQDAPISPATETDSPFIKSGGKRGRSSAEVELYCNPDATEAVAPPGRDIELLVLPDKRSEREAHGVQIEKRR